MAKLGLARFETISKRQGKESSQRFDNLGQTSVKEGLNQVQDQKSNEKTINRVRIVNV